MQITHEEAHRLIQFKSDNALNSKSMETLKAHLKDCADCRGYSDELTKIEGSLREAMRKQWSFRPLPLQMDVVKGKINTKADISTLLTTRTALISIAFALFVFITWQSVMTNNEVPQQTLLGTVPLIPTPSTQFTATNILLEGCNEIRYKVQENDTLESIAKEFSTSKEAISAANDLKTEETDPGMELMIPFCDSTPTSTMHPPTFTITPIFETTATTPG